MQIEGIFDIPPSKQSAEKWTVDLSLPDNWNVGLIVGPSGSGKTTVARELFGDYIFTSAEWSHDRAIIDDFPRSMSINEITKIMSSVGFSSPPSWLRPFDVLSNGEQFRVNMARALCESKEILVVDEFTSVVDRTVAQIGSAAVQRYIRESDKKFIAVSCHYDIVEWLEPDWIYQPHTNILTVGRSLHQRPKIELTIKRVHSSAWKMFSKHHYLSSDINTSAVCFCAFIGETPVAFSAVLHFPHPRKANYKRGHRTVCLPDYQGIGIGSRLSDFIGSLVRGIGCGYISTTSNPAMIRHRAKSKKWKMTRTKGTTSFGGNGKVARDLSKTHSYNRNSISFEYVGEALPRETALSLWNS